ncbi:zinc finger protein 574-like isoform X1 [Myxocyprinus asiaticus]|uniref:zinc finger protein 574-like isoform X1 n=1 Tax=Myxocyprinus asiaticus TaxID=70543 RepID=UPI002223A085|nr:zinc finger protein 574-like isoform X1 [Myxocyprinus asiaticus]
MESTSVYMCFPCYQEFPTLEEVLAHQMTCTAENPHLVTNETPIEAVAAAAGLPQVAMQSQTQTAVDLSSLLGQKKADAPRVLYQCAVCEVLFDALSLWLQHRKMGCCLETGPGPGGDQGELETDVKEAQAHSSQPEWEQDAHRQMEVNEERGQPQVKMENTSQEYLARDEVSEKIVSPESSQQDLQCDKAPLEPPKAPGTQVATSVEPSTVENSPATRRRGQKKVKPPSSLLCVECGQSFSAVPELVTHRKIQHGLKDAIHRCTVCGEGFLNTTLFLYHRRQHRREVEGKAKLAPLVIQQFSTAVLDAPGEGLLLLATAGEGQSLMEVTTMEQTITQTPVAQMEVELDSNGMTGEEAMQNDQVHAEEGAVSMENSEVLVDNIVEMVEERTEIYEEERMEMVPGNIEGEQSEDMQTEKAVISENQEEVESKSAEEPVTASSSGTEGQNFLCQQCGSSFPNEQELTKHRSTKHGLEAPMHTCTECGAEFMSTTHFLYHRREHRLNGPAGQTPSAEEKCRLFPASALTSTVKCRDDMPLRKPAATADATLEAPAKLSRDWSRTALPHECPHCGKGFTRRSLLREHVFNHTGEKLFNCKVCKKGFPSPASLLRHQLTHGGSRLFSCPICEKCFFQATSLKRHMLIHQTGETQERWGRGRGKGRTPSPNDGRAHICPECPASFNFEYQLESHRLLHTSHPFPCNVCGEAFIRRKDLDLHYLIHQDKEPKTCPNCSSQFLNQAVLDTHLQHCTGEVPVHCRYKGQGRGKVGGQLECDMCGHRCVTQDGLDLHRLSHMGQTPLRCPLAPCRRRFASSSALGEHLAAHCRGALGKKNTPRRFSCEFCGKEFAYPSTFTVHMRTHTNDRPFECSQCGKRFRQLPHLQDHERIHSGERPFTCWVCGKSFSVAARLTEHAHVHSGERPYVCTRCPTAFRSRSNLDKHMRLHANDPIDLAAQSMLDDDAAVQTILLVQESALSSPSFSSSAMPVVQEGKLVAEENGTSVVFLHHNLSMPTITVPTISVPSVTVSNISVVAGQDVPHTIEVILEETV